MHYVLIIGHPPDKRQRTSIRLKVLKLNVEGGKRETSGGGLVPFITFVGRCQEEGGNKSRGDGPTSSLCEW